jgi:DNA-directed RNA polymerase beta' subunit
VLFFVLWKKTVLCREHIGLFVERYVVKVDPRMFFIRFYLLKISKKRIALLKHLNLMPKVSSIKRFGKSKTLIAPSNLNEIQLASYDWFLKKGLRELLDEISPIRDHTGKEFELHFLDYRFDEPKYDEATARYKEATYEAPLRCIVRLTNKLTGREEEQEIYCGDFPVMTQRGTFIISGVERVVVSQLVRSAGVYFTATPYHGRSLFGAKIIPNRGAWLEFETDIDGQISVKIDRRRKVPVTDMLRIFGMTNDQIRAAFEDIDTGVTRHIETTLKKDGAQDAAESYVEIYRRLRPGDPASPETAKNLVSAMFERADRYDLSDVGRYKMNQRLAGDRAKKTRLLDSDDLVAIVRMIIESNNDPDREPDDIDHLGNRRLKAVGELLQGRLRIGFSHIRRIVQDRMSTENKDTLLPAQLVNFRPITAAVKEFFASSQLSQFMDQVNPLAELEHKRRISALGPGGLTRERASFEVRDVHPSHYGRICPIQTPEGANIGLINYLASFTRVNELGFLEAPYAKVTNGKVTKEIVWFDASEEEKYRIGTAGCQRDADGKILSPIIEARLKGEPTKCVPTEIDYIDVAPHEFISVATSLIPFLQNDDATRALMGANMQRQAVVSVHPDAPYVSTGEEDRVSRDSGYVVMADTDGVVLEADAAHVKVKYEKETKEYTLETFKRSNQFTCISQRPLVVKGDMVKKGQVIVDGPSTENGTLALGQNLLVAFLSWEGANFEDAIILSERVVHQDRFTSIHIDNYDCDVRDTKLGPEVTTYDIPNVSEDKLRNLDEEGVVRIGAEVKAGDILVGKITPKGESDLTSEERLLRAIFGDKARDMKDTSLTLPHGKIGRVVNVKIFDRERGDRLEPGIIRRIHVEIAELRKAQSGDKLAGRHGNKGVVSQVRAVEDMPYLADGTPVDIILNPLGVVSRMNLGQILETHLGWAASKLGYRAITPGLDSATESEIRAELVKAGLPEDGKVKLYDGRSGEAFQNNVMVGMVYMMKLNHLVEDKAHMRSIGPYSLITQQPLGGKAQFGGQRFGEMEVWALEGYGARHTLQEMLTIKSDDVMGRAAAYESIIRGEQIKEPNVPASFNVLVNELKSLALNIQPLYEHETDRKDSFSALKISVASSEDIMKWSHGEITKPETINYRTQRPEKDGLFSERIFGPTKDYECYCGKYRRIRYKGVVCDKCGVEVTKAAVRRERIGHITLAAPVGHIWFLKSIPSRLGLALDVSAQKLERVIYYSAYIITDIKEDHRKSALEELDRELKGKLKIVGKDKETKGDIMEAAETTRDYLKTLRIGQVLGENEYFALSRKFGNVFKAGSGAEAVRDILEHMDLKKEIRTVEAQLENAKDPMDEAKLLRRLKMFKAMVRNGTRPEWMILTVLPVLPPDLRPMVALDGGRYATSDLNDLYRRVINRNNRLKKLLEIKAPDVIVRNEKRMLQEAVDALIDNSARFGTQQMSAQRRPLRSLADMLKGKQGRFRQNLLGKRVDYSGRSVIVVGPKLALDQCGIPKRMALELFRPFVVSEILKRGLAHNIRSANRFIEERTPEVLGILEEVIKDKYVLLNRAPTLHRLSVQAFRPHLVEGLALKIPPLVCPAFNADFDGDQMAVHLPLSERAQKEAREIMSAGRGLLKPASGELVASPTQDVVLGIYYLTREDVHPSAPKGVTGINEALLSYHKGAITFHTPIRLNGMDTTLGRLIFNEALEGSLPFVNKTIKKKDLQRTIEAVLDQHGLDTARRVLDRVKLLGFEMATTSGISWAISDLLTSNEKKGIIAGAAEEIKKVDDQYMEGLLTSAERRVRVIGVWGEANAKIGKAVSGILPHENPVYQIIDSGARGSSKQLVQIIGMKGQVANSRNETIELPIISSFKEGLSVLEYFISTNGARKGTADTALKTSHAGYLTRRLVDVAQDLTVREEDCKSKEGIELFREDGKEFNQSFASKLFSRTALDDIKIGNKIVVRAGEIIGKPEAEIIDQSKLDSVIVRSPITCKTFYGICSKCYGYDLGNNEPVKIGTAAGVIAAQSIGEPGTQLTMRTFHTGGVAGADITHGLPRVEEIFEMRTPKGQAILAPFDGIVERIEERGTLKVMRLVNDNKKAKALEVSVPRGTVIFIKAKDVIKKGDQLSEGNMDIKELYENRGQMEVARYIVNEIQKIYMAEGSPINNKHIEMIIRQMFSRVKVRDAGDALDFVMGDVIERSRLLEVNKDLKKAGERPAKADDILLGITKVALSSDSFLSAASFQDTARVLVKAALESKVDRLRGLKENVIIGRLIPAGASSINPEEIIDELDPEAELERPTKEIVAVAEPKE